MSAPNGPIDGFRPPALTHEQELQVVKWIAYFVPPKEIPAKIHSTFGIAVDRTYAYRFAREDRKSVV